MRIGIDARFYGIIGKGLGRYTEQLILGLERLDTTGDEYIIFLRKENFDEYVPTRPNFRKVLADYQWYSFAEQWGFVRLLNRLRCDLVHFPHFNVPMLYHRPFIVTIHDLILRHHPTKKASTRHAVWYWAKVVAYRVVIASAVRRARMIIAVSKFTRDDLRQVYPFLRRRRIAVTYESAEHFCRWQSPEQARETLQEIVARADASVSENAGNHDILKGYFLYVGNAYPHKNLEQLVRTMSRSVGTERRLILVGREDYFYRRLKHFAHEQGATNCLFVGGVSDAELAVLYCFARGYVFPSLYEGFGLPPLEAMTYGVPTLVARNTSLPEVVGEASLLFDARDPEMFQASLDRFWMDDGLRGDLRERGWQRAAMFSWDRMAKETQEIYQYSVSKSEKKK